MCTHKSTVPSLPVTSESKNLYPEQIFVILKLMICSFDVCNIIHNSINKKIVMGTKKDLFVSESF